MSESMKPRVEFIQDFPKELEKAVLEALKPHLPLVEKELEVLYVSMADVTGDVPGVAAVNARTRYHKANMWLSSEFFSYDQDEQEKTILHELFHILLDPLTREAQHVTLNFVDDERAKRHLLETLEELEERVVDGLSIAVLDARS